VSERERGERGVVTEDRKRGEIFFTERTAFVVVERAVETKGPFVFVFIILRPVIMCVRPIFMYKFVCKYVCIRPLHPRTFLDVLCQTYFHFCVGMYACKYVCICLAHPQMWYYLKDQTSSHICVCLKENI